ncbi:MAG TPA: GNAT family N-acetyltransferase [Acidimicrobiales bacterium]
MADHLVRTATDDDGPALIGFLSRAFATDPLFEWVFPDEERRVADLALLFELVWAANSRLGHSLITDDRTGIAMWAPPGQWKTPPETAMTYGPRLVEAYAEDDMRRLMSFHDAVDEHHPEESHYYLGVLGVDPDHHARGIGSACLAAGLAVADAAHQPAYLETTNEKNLPLYERHGFAVTKEFDLGDGSPTTWLMWRDAG